MIALLIILFGIYAILLLYIHNLSKKINKINKAVRLIAYDIGDNESDIIDNKNRFANKKYVNHSNMRVNTVQVGLGKHSLKIYGDGIRKNIAGKDIYELKFDDNDVKYINLITGKAIPLICKKDRYEDEHERE
jgi:hypothetical protein